MVEMKERVSRGFTLIELLVVIAIIGLLAAVVLASVGSARTKGADASVKSNFANVRTQAELVASNNGNVYNATADSVCALAGSTQNPTIAAALLSAKNAVSGSTTVCNMTSTAWAASSEMSTQNLVGAGSGTDYWCVDSTGASKLETAALGTLTACAP